MISLIKILTIIMYSALATTHNIPASQVLELSDKFLDIYQEGQWLVMMCRPWCEDCKKLEPVWDHVVQYLHATSVRVGRVDCTRFASVAQTFKIEGFPTIIFFKGDQQFVYNGDKTSDDIVQFAHRLSRPAVQEVTKPASTNNFTDHHTLEDQNKLNETLYTWTERFPTFRRATRGVTDETCVNCTNCTNCTYSTNILNCTNCTGCTNCMGCTGCVNCTNCTNCTNCSNCTNCVNCSNCSNLTNANGRNC